MVGFREVKKFLLAKKLKLIFLAPDMEKNVEVDKLIEEVKSIADQLNIPYVFCLKRRHIGYLLLKKAPIGVVGIFDYQGTHDNVSKLLGLVESARIDYVNKSKDIT